MKTLKSILAVVVFLFATIATQAQEIFDAARTGNLAKVKELIEANPQLVNTKDSLGRTPLHWASRGVHFEFMKYLVEKGANVNAKDNNGIAPLHSFTSRATTKTHLDGTNFLISNRVDVNTKTNNGYTPLHYSIISRNINLVKLLLENGADFTVMTNGGDSPLDFAINASSKEIIDLLLDKGAEINTDGIKGILYLQLAAGNGFDRLFKKIIEKEGKNLFIDKEKNSWTMQDAITGGSVDNVKLLIENSVPLDKKGDIYGWTSLHYAASKGRLKIIEFIVSNGVNINAKTKAGETAYNIAESNNYDEAKNLILKLGGNKEPQKFPVLKGKYFGQKPPGMKPEIFAPGIISTADKKDMNISFSPDCNEMYFYRLVPNDSITSKIYYCKVLKNRWTAPQHLSITVGYNAGWNHITFDNKRLYFTWFRPDPTVDPNSTLYRIPSIWFLERTKEGWSTPKYAGKGMGISSTRDGQLYSDYNTPNNEYAVVKLTVKDGVFKNYEKLNISAIAHPCIAPDGSFIIFDHGNGDHILVSFKKKDGTWGEAIDLTKNGFEPLAGIPSISPDGKYLFFKQGCRGELDVAHSSTNRDIWWVDIKVIEKLRPKN